MLALRPRGVEFVETVLFSPDQQWLVEEIETGEDSPLVGSTLKEIEDCFPGVVIVALKKKDGALVTSPKPETAVPVASSLVAFGTAEQLHAIEVCCQPSAAKTQPAKKTTTG